MNILEIVSGRGFNGAVAHCLLLSRELARRGHRVTVVCRPNTAIHQQLPGSGVEIIASDLHRWPPGELQRIGRLARERHIDVIHTHMSRAHFFGVLLRWFSGLPSVATAHNRLIQLHWMFNDRVIAVSEATRRFQRRFNLVRDSKIDVVHNFIDLDRIAAARGSCRKGVRESLGVPADALLMTVVGEVLRRKGLLYLVRAMPQILSAVPHARLAVVGGTSFPYHHAVRAEANRLGVQAEVTWAGERRDIPELLAATDVFVLPTLEDNLPLSILEAMAAGLPVVSTAVGGLPECVVPEKTGYLVPPADPGALAQALITLLRSPALRRELGQRGWAHVRRGFSPESQTPRVEAVLAKAAGVQLTETACRAVA